MMRCGFEISKQEYTPHTMHTGSLINVVACSTVASADPNPAPGVGPDARNMFSVLLAVRFPLHIGSHEIWQGGSVVVTW